MPDIALYFPDMRVRNETWLKAAALYWPKLALLTPPGYEEPESETAKVLRDQLDFFVHVDPLPHTKDVGKQFLNALGHLTIAADADAIWSDRLDELRVAGRASPSDPDALSSHDLAFGRSGFALDQGAYRFPIERVNVRKIHAYVALHLERSGLGVRLTGDSSPDAWISLDQRLAAVYIAALAERAASANAMPVITDRPALHGVLNGWDVDTLVGVLFNEPDDPPGRAVEEVSALYASVAISAVIPKGLDDIRPDQIVVARQRLAAEFDAFRDHLDSMNETFAELSNISSPDVLRARLELLVERDLRRPTADLERSLRKVGLEPARTVLGLKSLELPAIAAATLTGAGVPVAVGQAGLVAAQFVASSALAHQRARDIRRAAAGYLLGLREELNPAGVVDRVRRTFRRVWSRR